MTEDRNALIRKIHEQLDPGADSAAQALQSQLVQAIAEYVQQHPFTEEEMGIAAGDPDESMFGKICVRHDAAQALVEALRAKKRIALEGRPAFGRVFAAQELAYGLVGREDPDHVVIAEFGPRYSMADFMGEGPAERNFLDGGGIFFRLCRTAAESREPYVLVINETQPGKVGEIFRELDRQMQDQAAQQAWKQLYGMSEDFSVPENVYVYALTALTGSDALPPYSFEARPLRASMQLTELISVAEMGDHSELREILDVVEAINSVMVKSLGTKYCLQDNLMCPCALEGGHDVLTFEMRRDLNPLMDEYGRLWAAGWRERRDRADGGA